MSRVLALGFVSKAALWVVAALLILVLTGCAGAPGMTAREVDRRHINATTSNWRMIQDDIDSIFMWDQPLRLSEMPVR